MITVIDKYFFIFFSLLTFSSCRRHEESISWDQLERQYRERKDTLSLHALEFLKANLGDHTFDSAIFFSKTGLPIPKPSSDKEAMKLINAGEISFKNAIFNDKEIINTEFIQKTINNAISSYHKYPWANRVPEEIFLNYVLAYKIFNDRPAYYRPFFQMKYKEYCMSLFKKITSDSIKFKYDPNELFYQIAVDDIGKWFKYSDDYIQFARTPSFGNLLKYCSGDCIRAAYFNVYALRSLSLPCTVDFVPNWGSKNGGHAQEVFYDQYKKGMRTPSGRSLDRAAKIIRYTFSKQNRWSNSILPYLHDPNQFKIEYLKSNYWIDVTHEHTHTKDIILSKSAITGEGRFYYICIYNYNQWVPTFWGTQVNNQIHFKNMGTDILYWVGEPYKNTIRLKGKPFILQSDGTLKYFNITKDHITGVRLTKINSGDLSWVQKHHRYKLAYLDDDNRWKTISVNECVKDSIIEFPSAPANVLYKLQDLNSDKDLSRIFIINNTGDQKWY